MFKSVIHIQIDVPFTKQQSNNRVEWLMHTSLGCVLHGTLSSYNCSLHRKLFSICK